MTAANDEVEAEGEQEQSSDDVEDDRWDFFFSGLFPSIVVSVWTWLRIEPVDIAFCHTGDAPSSVRRRASETTDRVERPKDTRRWNRQVSASCFRKLTIEKQAESTPHVAGHVGVVGVSMWRCSANREVDDSRDRLDQLQRM